MTTGRSVQFMQSGDVINAYELRAVPAFSVYQNKQLLMKYEGETMQEGAELLSQFLECLQNSAAIYTLCVYEEFQGKINDKTPYHGSWNFRFQSDTAGYINAGNNFSRELAAMNKRLDDLTIKRIGAPEEEEEKNSIVGFMDRADEIASHPLVERFLPMILGAIGVKMPPESESKIVAASLAGLNDKTVGPALIDAVRKMITAVPSCENKLIELGKIAETNPTKFSQLVGYLNLI